MQKDMWVAKVDLSTTPRTYAEPKKYEVNVLPTSDGSDVATYGSRLSTIERARMDRWYGKDIGHYDRVWVLEQGSPEPPNDKLASTATHVVRAIKDTPLIRTVELRRLVPYDDEYTGGTL